MAEIRAGLGLTQADFSALLGVKRSYLSEVENGKGKPSLDMIVGIASKLPDISLTWVLTGLGGMHRDSALVANKNGQISKVSALPEGMIGIPLIEAHASAGHGAVVWADGTVNFIYLNEAWLRETYRVNPANLVVLPSAGESMEPTIKAAELLLVDRSATGPGDGIYVLRLDGHLLVKRLQCLPGGLIRVSSDNHAYEPFTVRLDEGADFTILGRVVLAMGLRHM